MRKISDLDIVPSIADIKPEPAVDMGHIPPWVEIELYKQKHPLGFLRNFDQSQDSTEPGISRQGRYPGFDRNHPAGWPLVAPSCRKKYPKSHHPPVGMDRRVRHSIDGIES
jgi:hypothetical protein